MFQVDHFWFGFFPAIVQISVNISKEEKGKGRRWFADSALILRNVSLISVSYSGSITRLGVGRISLGSPRPLASSDGGVSTITLACVVIEPAVLYAVSWYQPPRAGLAASTTSQAPPSPSTPILSPGFGAKVCPSSEKLALGGGALTFCQAKVGRGTPVALAVSAKL